MLLCLIVDGWDEAAGAAALLEVAPRVALGEGGVVWLDARGLDAAQLYAAALARLGELGAARVRAGAASRPVVAWLAAQESAAVAPGASSVTSPANGSLRLVADGEQATFVAAQPLTRLGLDARMLGLLEGVGIASCGELAALPREAMEVRFGAEAVHWWRLARGEDERRPFGPVPPEAPQASLEFIDYVVTSPERLLFTANALLGSICDQLLEQGAHARRLTLALTLGNGSRWERELRPARPTASRSTWLRLVRSQLERLTVPDAVAGMALAAGGLEPAGAVQGDLFDVGFATAGAVEAALTRLVEEQGAVVVRPVATSHPLIEQRVSFEPVDIRQATSVPPPAGASAGASGGAFGAVAAAGEAAGGGAAAQGAGRATEVPGALTLQLLEQPRPVLVETVARRDHEVPVRYRDGGRWLALVSAAGPDRVSGGQWERSYAREYFRAVTVEGTLVWLFRDARRDRWYLHGWWD